MGDPLLKILTKSSHITIEIPPLPAGYALAIDEEDVRKVLGLFKDEYLRDLKKIRLGRVHRYVDGKVIVAAQKEEEEVRRFPDFSKREALSALVHEIGHHMLERAPKVREEGDRVWERLLRRRIAIITDQDIPTAISRIAMRKMGLVPVHNSKAQLVDIEMGKLLQKTFFKRQEE